MTRDKRLLIWTENYWIGGCDRFLVDLVAGLRTSPVSVALAGNPHPEFDAWLARRAPWVPRRTVIPIANAVRTPLHRLDRWRGGAEIGGGPGGGGPEAGGLPAPSGGGLPAPSGGDLPAPSGEPLPWRAGAATLRYGQAALNLVRLRRLLARARPDVLLINNGGYPGGESCRVAAIAARQAGVPRVVHFVHNMAHDPAWPQSLERALDRAFDRATDHWVTAAHRASDELSRRRRIDRRRVATVHYGIDAPPAPAAAESDRERPELLVVANLEPRKGLGVLVQALARLRDGGVTLPAAIVGEGPMRAQIEADVRRLGLEATVRLLGWRDDVDALMDAADVLALPSLGNECLPYVILEAMAHRLPVVSTDVAGIPEMVLDGQTGRIVAPGDAAALAAALKEALDPARARAWGERGQARVRACFGAETMTSAMRDLLGIG